MYTYVLEGGCPIPCSEDFVSQWLVLIRQFSNHILWNFSLGRSLPKISWKPFKFDEVCTSRKKIEQEIYIYKGKKKNIGLSEMHNIFVAADEEKRKTFMKKQINNTKRKKNENSKKTG